MCGFIKTKILLLTVSLCWAFSNSILAQDKDHFPIGVWSFRAYLPDSTDVVAESERILLRKLGVNYLIGSWVRREVNVMNFCNDEIAAGRFLQMNILGDGVATKGKTDTLFQNHSRFAYRFPDQSWKAGVRKILQKINRKFAFQPGFADVLMVTGEISPSSPNNKFNHVWEGYEFIAEEIDSLRRATGSGIKSLLQTGWRDSSAVVDFSGMLEHVPDMDIFAMQHYVFDSTDTIGDQNTIQEFAHAMWDAAQRLKRKYDLTGKKTDFRPIIQTQSGFVQFYENGRLVEKRFRRPTHNEILLQVNLALANGAKGIIYYKYHNYRYWNRNTGRFNYERGLVDYPRGDSTEQYSNVRAISRNYLMKAGEHFLPLQWQTSFSVHGNNAEPLAPQAGIYDVISEEDVEGETFVEIGYFADSDSAREARYMIVNRRTEAPRTITVMFQRQPETGYRVENEFTGEKRFYRSDEQGRFQHKVFLKEGEGVLLSVNGTNN